MPSTTTYKSRGEELQTASALEIANDRIAQLEREIKNKAETIEQLRDNNATLASDALALATAKEIVFGEDNTADNMQLFEKLREWKTKAARIDKFDATLDELLGKSPIANPQSKIGEVQS